MTSASTRTYLVSVTARLAAPPDKVYATIANYHTGHPRIGCWKRSQAPRVRRNLLL